MALGTLVKPSADPRTPLATEKLEATSGGEIQELVWGLAARVDPTVDIRGVQASAPTSSLKLSPGLTTQLTCSLARYWADIQRAEEHEENKRYVEERGPLTVAKVIKNRFSKGIQQERATKEKKQNALQVNGGPAAVGRGEDDTRKLGDITSSNSSGRERVVVTEEEWKTSARALRTASWGTIFFIITMDILG